MRDHVCALACLVSSLGGTSGSLSLPWLFHPVCTFAKSGSQTLGNRPEEFKIHMHWGSHLSPDVIATLCVHNFLLLEKQKRLVIFVLLRSWW